jgi:thermitase
MRCSTLFLIVTLLCTLVFPPSSAAADTSSPASLIIRVRAGLSLNNLARVQGNAPQLEQALAAIGATAAHRIGAGSDTYRIYLRPISDLRIALQHLQTQADIIYAEPNRLRTAQLAPNDPLYENQDALASIHAAEAWEITVGGAVPIAVLDTGVSPTHLDLKGKLLPGYDFVNRDSDPRDDDGHGTYTAGVAAAVSNNNLGVAGVCWGCPIMPIKVLNRRGQGDDATIAEGLRWAADNGARIISMSLGGPEDTRVLREAIEYAHTKGALIVAASGNGQADGNLPSYPAAYEQVVAVSATRSDDGIAGFSTTGAYVDLAAPGEGVLSTFWSIADSDHYGVASGTSAAAPHVAGAAGLIWSIRPELTADQLADVLRMGTDDRGPIGIDPEYGYGRLNVQLALEQAQDPSLLQQSRIEGFVGGANPTEAIVSLSNGQTTRPDASGFYRFSELAAGSYTISVNGPGLNIPSQTHTLRGTRLHTVIVDLGIERAASSAFAAVPPPQTTADVRYYAETGHTLRGTFRQYWDQHGGLAIFGYPISEEFRERSDDGRERIVQYFERHRFELHSDLRAPYHVQLTRLGDRILQVSGRSWFSFPKGIARPNCRYFAETEHSLCEPFLSYWRANGLEFDGRRGKSVAESLALFGQPISEPTIETMPDGRLLLVQWFERARFEDHGPEGGVLLGLLGNELAAQRGLR